MKKKYRNIPSLSELRIDSSSISASSSSSSTSNGSLSNILKKSISYIRFTETFRLKKISKKKKLDNSYGCACKKFTFSSSTISSNASSLSANDSLSTRSSRILVVLVVIVDDERTLFSRDSFKYASAV